MSDEKALEIKPTTDIVGKDREELDEYIEKGAPGIGEVDESQIKKMFDMYLSGKPYRRISEIMFVPKVLVTYLSERLNWFGIRQEYFEEMESTIRPRVGEDNIQTLDFLLNARQMLRKQLGSKMDKYMKTGDETIANQIDWKKFDRLLKITEILQKAFVVPQAKGPLVSVNIPGAATLTRTNENEIEITPKENAQKSMLKQYAEALRNKKEE